MLDRFELDRASLVGMSMGGHWALRAAAYEERIDRVVCWPPVYDWLFRARHYAPDGPEIRSRVKA